MQRERRVAFLVYDLVWADKSDGILPFSYGARTLDASLRSAPDLADVETTIIELRDDNPDAFFEKIRAFRPTIVAASAYIWSVKLFCQLAEMTRRWDPSVRFVMGGPAARPSLLGLPPYAPYLKYIDAVVTGEGEEIIREIAREHLAEDWRRSVAGLSIPGPLGWRRTTPADRPVLDDYPSPYQLGTIPYDEKGFLETFRGCPINCAFCQWGDERADRVYSADYLTSHLQGLDTARVTSVYVVDAGFNLSPRAFRNLVEAEKRVGALKSRTIFGHVYPTYIRDDHLEFFASVGHAEVAVGVQSFDEEALKKLGRPFDLTRFERALEEIKSCSSISIELILGLPGDNPASFRHTFEKSLQLGGSLRVFYCLALPDALLDRAEEFNVSFDPETFKVRSCEGWTPESLHAEWEHVLEVARKMHRPSFGPNWVGFRTDEPSAREMAVKAAMPIPSETLHELRLALETSPGDWHLGDGRIQEGRLELDLHENGGSQGLLLEAIRAREGQRRFTEHEGVAYSYRGTLRKEQAAILHQVILQLHGRLRPFLYPSTSKLLERRALIE